MAISLDGGGAVTEGGGSHRSAASSGGGAVVVGVGGGSLVSSGSFLERVLRSTTMDEFDRLLEQNEGLLFDLVGLLPEEVRLHTCVGGRGFCLT